MVFEDSGYTENAVHCCVVQQCTALAEQRSNRMDKQKNVRKSVSLTVHEAANLSAYAKSNEVSESWVLRKALQEFLERNPGGQLALSNMR